MFYFSEITEFDIFKYGLSIKKNRLINFSRLKKRSVSEKEILKNAKYIIGRTDWDKRITSVLAENAKYFHNDETLRKHFYLERWENYQIDEEFNLFTITADVPYKGIKTVIQTAEILDNLGKKFKWNIAGLTHKSKVIKILNRKFNKISKNIIIKGILDEREIIKTIKKSHIYIMPSNIENGSIALSEAMIMGIPVISTFAGGTSSQLKDGEEGIMIQPGDPYSLAGSILEIVNNYDEAVKKGKIARLKAMKRHDPEKIIYELIDIYKSILKK